MFGEFERRQGGFSFGLVLLLSFSLQLTDAHLMIDINKPATAAMPASTIENLVPGGFLKAKIKGNSNGEECTVRAKFNDLGPVDLSKSELMKDAVFEEKIGILELANLPVEVNITGAIKIPTEICGNGGLTVSVICGDTLDQTHFGIKIPCKESENLDLVFELLPSEVEIPVVEPNKEIDTNVVLKIKNNGNTDMQKRLILDSLDILAAVVPNVTSLLDKGGYKVGKNSPQEISDFLSMTIEEEFDNSTNIPEIIEVHGTGPLTVDWALRAGEVKEIDLSTLRLGSNPVSHIGEYSALVLYIDPSENFNDVNMENNMVTLLVKLKDDDGILSPPLCQVQPITYDAGYSSFIMGKDYYGQDQLVEYTVENSIKWMMDPHEMKMEYLNKEASRRDAERLMDMQRCTPEMMDDLTGKQIIGFKHIDESMAGIIADMSGIQHTSEPGNIAHDQVKLVLTAIQEMSKFVKDKNPNSEDGITFLSEILIFSFKENLKQMAMQKKVKKCLRYQSNDERCHYCMGVSYDYDRSYHHGSRYPYEGTNEYGSGYPYPEDNEHGSGYPYHKDNEHGSGYPYHKDNEHGSGYPYHNGYPYHKDNEHGSGYPYHNGYPFDEGNEHDSGYPYEEKNYRNEDDTKYNLYGGNPYRKNQLEGSKDRPYYFQTTKSDNVLLDSTGNPSNIVEVMPTKAPNAKDVTYFCLKKGSRKEINYKIICDGIVDCDNEFDENEDFCSSRERRRATAKQIQAILKGEKWENVKSGRSASMKQKSTKTDGIALENWSDARAVINALTTEEKEVLKEIAEGKSGKKKSAPIKKKKAEKKKNVEDTVEAEMVENFIEGMTNVKSEDMKRRPQDDGMESSKDKMIHKLMNCFGSQQSQGDAPLMYEVMHKTAEIIKSPTWDMNLTVLSIPLKESIRNVMKELDDGKKPILFFDIWSDIIGNKSAPLHMMLKEFGNKTHHGIMERKKNGEAPFTMLHLEQILDFFMSDFLNEATRQVKEKGGKGMDEIMNKQLDIIELSRSYLKVLSKNAKKLTDLAVIGFMMKKLPEKFLSDIDGYPGKPPSPFEQCWAMSQDRMIIIGENQMEPLDEDFVGPRAGKLLEANTKPRMSMPAFWKSVEMDIDEDGYNDGTAIVQIKYSKLTGQYHHKIKAVCHEEFSPYHPMDIPEFDIAYDGQNRKHHLPDDDIEEDDYNKLTEMKKILNELQYTEKDIEGSLGMEEFLKVAQKNSIFTRVLEMSASSPDLRETIRSIISNPNYREILKNILESPTMNRELERVLSSTTDMSRVNEFFMNLTVTNRKENMKNTPEKDSIYLLNRREDKTLNSMSVEGIISLNVKDANTTICGEGFGQTEANVVCRSLLVSDARLHNYHVSRVQSLSQADDSKDLPPIHLTDLSCSEEVPEISSLMQCSHMWTEDSSKCSYGERAAVSCKFEKKKRNKIPK